MISRRLFLRNASAVGATVAAPVAVEAAQPEYIGDRVSRLLKELTEALTEFGDGQFKAVVYPTMHKSGVTHLEDANASLKTQAMGHMRQLQRLAREDGGEAYVFVSAQYPDRCRTFALQPDEDWHNPNGMFDPKGGAA